MKPAIVRFLLLPLLKFEYSSVNIYVNAQRISDSWETKSWSPELEEIENQVIMNPVEFHG
jgi:hypothetical protein